MSMREQKTSENDNMPMNNCNSGNKFRPLLNQFISFAASRSSPRVWFLTSGLSPISIRLIRKLLGHGEYIAVGLRPIEIDSKDEDISNEYWELVNECQSEKRQAEGWKDRFRGIRCEGRAMSQCGAAIAETIQVYGRIDILLCCTSEGVVGTVEELAMNQATKSLVQDQFESIFYSHVNYIKSILPYFREKNNGHIMILSSICGHLGSPGISMFCAATRALEGYCDSLAYEIAPFNVKLTIIQTNKEVNLLSGRLKFTPRQEPYENGHKSVIKLRNILASVIDGHLKATTDDTTRDNEKIISKYPCLSDESRDKLVMETVFALYTIGGHVNPPIRHIVGHEAVASVKERLKNASEELEDYVKVGCSVDILKEESRQAAHVGDTVELNL
ncbi:putative short chain dehydrogenase reductase family protein [Erysiphe neolycopersici]|uniref:Putative short chain dehydrogenase reductase family protein n=1 Tax=Erysiphe neolycopersici TaxID=212602 RepID=A0A420I5R6_9PEZI|nr:putative short chain dehydrogenase reductase family protein [Erysiphe neolycopersici]